jgi:transcription-repair coupling factor (superfamily II helicase)
MRDNEYNITPELDSWRHVDIVLKEEDEVLGCLRMAVEHGYMSDEELEEIVEAYHHSKQIDG